MRDLSSFGRIFVAVDPVDFRKHAHGLALVVEQAFDIRTSDDKKLFIFTNKRRNAVKILYWDNTGYAMWWKTLERDKFRWPKSTESTLIIKTRELRWLLEGIDFTNIKPHEKLKIG
jgi:transposase